MGYNGPTAVTRVGNTAWVLEAKLAWMSDPKLKDRDPRALKVYAVSAAIREVSLRPREVMPLYAPPRRSRKTDTQESPSHIKKGSNIVAI